MNLHGMLELLHLLPAYRQLVTTGAQEQKESAPLALLSAARPFLVAGLRMHRARPLLLITARAEMAQQLAHQLALWLPPTDADGPPVYLFAEPDALPYERISWSSTTRQRRLTVLAALQSRAGVAPLVVCSARALMQKTLPPRELRLALRSIEVGRAVRLEQLVSGWVQTGYNPADIVEEPGTFARRGGIVDIWPPNLSQPVRIDLFGDEVDSLRRFDPASQRTLEHVRSVEIGPGSEVLSKYGPKILERLNVHGDHLNAPGNVASGDRATPLQDPGLLLAIREEIRHEVGQLQASHSFHGVEWYMPYCYDQPASLLDYMGADATVVVDEALDLFPTMLELEQQADQLKAELEHAGELPRGFGPSHFMTEQLRSQLVERRPLLLGYGDLYGRATEANTPLARCFIPGPRFGGKVKEIVANMVKLRNAGDAVLLTTRQAARLRDLLQEVHLVADLATHLTSPPAPGVVTIVQGLAAEGFIVRGLETAAVGDAGAHAVHLERVHFYTDTELFGWSKPQARPRSKPHSTVAPEIFFADVKPGDYVVHIEHGIGRFEGLVHMELAGIEREYLLVTYARDDKLYVPVHQADRLSRYVGTGETVPAVNRLGTADWQLVKERAKRAVAEIADDLLVLYAERELVTGHAYSPDSPWQEELEAAFPYQETEDQLNAVDAVKRDMESDRPMDRLVCGDVGYGKTEVGVRAAFKAITDGKQVAVLVPTTVLAQQHFRTISSRLSRFPMRVEMLSRFRTPAQQEKIIRGLHDGTIDLVVGTHRLLSEDVVFKDLGLLIIDEEQRFGVVQKEKLKLLRSKVDVLTLSATPIPRTLHMSLSGIRDMSTINTPPKERQPVHTILAEYDDVLVKQAIQRELGRRGQVFVVNDRVRGIRMLADRIGHLVPEAIVAIGHGQMNERELEEVMMRFTDGDIDVLVATTIIENGLDIPNANTIIINRADHFGLAQLYQLRGRVGRSAQRGHCYLLYEKHKPLSYDARRRLSAILESSEELGAGFRIAMRDLEIRGAGDLLGARQHGHIDSVGFDLYTRLLAQAINEARRRKDRFEEALATQEEKTDAAGERALVGAAAELGTVLGERAPAAGSGEGPARGEAMAFDIADPLTPPVQLDLPIDARIPIDYVEDLNLRLELYRRIAGITHTDALADMRRELVDRFGKDPDTASVPEAVENLLFQIRVKILAGRAGIDRIGRELDHLVLRTEALENMDRKTMERRLQLALGKLSADDETFIPEETARVGRRAVYLPLDDEGAWKNALVRTLQLMAVG